MSIQLKTLGFTKQSQKLDRFSLKSKSKNTPFDGAILQGKVIATYVGGVNQTQVLADA